MSRLKVEVKSNNNVNFLFSGSPRHHPSHPDYIPSIFSFGGNKDQKRGKVQATNRSNSKTTRAKGAKGKKERKTIERTERRRGEDSKRNKTTGKGT